jgi:putative hydrolase of the HAD superfamily
LINTILFDLDDTLYNEMQFVKGGFETVASYIAKKHHVNQQDIKRLLVKTLKKQGRGHVFDHVLEQLGLQNRIKIQALIKIYRTHSPNLVLYPDAAVLLSTLKKKKYKLGLITDGDVTAQKNKVSALQLERFFDCIIFSDEYGVKKRKPTPFPYEKMLEELHAKAKEAVYVGDNPTKDFISAKKLGMQTVRILRGPYKTFPAPLDYDADYTLTNLKSFINLLLRLE